ncbi:hypothetical protein MRX96_010075 [Rhipicephalus microplus]
MKMCDTHKLRGVVSFEKRVASGLRPGPPLEERLIVVAPVLVAAGRLPRWRGRGGCGQRLVRSVRATTPHAVRAATATEAGARQDVVLLARRHAHRQSPREETQLQRLLGLRPTDPTTSRRCSHGENCVAHVSASCTCRHESTKCASAGKHQTRSFPSRHRSINSGRHTRCTARRLRCSRAGRGSVVQKRRWTLGKNFPQALHTRREHKCGAAARASGRALPLVGCLRALGRRKAVLLLATFRVVEWAPSGEKNKQLVVAVFFLGQKSASVRVPVRLSPTRPRDKAPTRTAAALSRFDGAYPVVSASATFTPRRSPYYKEEGSDLSTGHIFSSAAKEGYPCWMTTVAMSMQVFRFICIWKHTFEKLATESTIQCYARAASEAKR